MVALTRNHFCREQGLFRVIQFEDPSIKAICGHVYIDGKRYNSLSSKYDIG